MAEKFILNQGFDGGYLQFRKHILNDLIIGKQSLVFPAEQCIDIPALVQLRTAAGHSALLKGEAQILSGKTFLDFCQVIFQRRVTDIQFIRKRIQLLRGGRVDDSPLQPGLALFRRLGYGGKYGFFRTAV